MEFSAPGFGLPGIVAIVCFALMLGSKYLIGMANWVEIAILFLGFALLLVELFVLPGFGVAGILGIALILAGLFGMLIRNAPNELPWPHTSADWSALSSGVLSLTLGFFGFLVLAWILSRYLPRFSFMSGLILAPSIPGRGAGWQISMTAPPENAGSQPHVKDAGTTVTRLRPAGKARFGEAIVDVVADGEFLDKDTKVTIIAIQGGRVVVRRAEPEGPA
jgi:membrane-bound serine protease (ClpP class)